MATEVVVNKCHGGFGVTKAVYDELGLEWDEYGHLTSFAREHDLSTNDFEFRSLPELVEAIKAVGVEEASGDFAKLRIVEIPDDAIDPRIEEYDGLEWVAEGRTW